MIIVLAQLAINILVRNTVRQNVMNGLNVEGFLDLGVRCKGKVKQY